MVTLRHASLYADDPQRAAEHLAALEQRVRAGTR
jgi:hypothetical protein